MRVCVVDLFLLFSLLMWRDVNRLWAYNCFEKNSRTPIPPCPGGWWNAPSLFTKFQYKSPIIFKSPLLIINNCDLHAIIWFNVLNFNKIALLDTNSKSFLFYHFMKNTQFIWLIFVKTQFVQFHSKNVDVKNVQTLF